MANEKLDVIDRNALLDEYDREHIGEPGKARKLIEEAPRVDAVEVVHGRWINEGDGDWRCSSCRKLFTFDDYGDVHPRDDCGFNYCYNCGAYMMDGDGNG